MCICVIRVLGAEAGEASWSDSCPSYVPCDSRHYSDVDSELIDASSNSVAEESPSLAQLPTFLPVPVEDCSAFTPNIGVQTKS